MLCKLFEQFEITDKGHKLPTECLEKIKVILNKNTLHRNNKCTLCSLEGLNVNEYLDGVGYICSGCLF